jgi:hypothetical protein
VAGLILNLETWLTLIVMKNMNHRLCMVPDNRVLRIYVYTRKNVEVIEDEDSCMIKIFIICIAEMRNAYFGW